MAVDLVGILIYLFIQSIYWFRIKSVGYSKWKYCLLVCGFESLGTEVLDIFMLGLASKTKYCTKATRAYYETVKITSELN
jgi:hypothetical protein